MQAVADRKLTIGSWSGRTHRTLQEGSTRTEEILSALLSMATVVGYESDRTEEAAHALEAITDDDHTCDADACAGDYADECVNDMIDALNEYAPIYCYIGMVEGDGANFGIWPSRDALGEAIRCSTKIDDGSYVNLDDMVFIQFSDHFNVEVYAIERGAPLLSLV